MILYNVTDALGWI